MSETYGDMRADYSATRPGRFQRLRRGIAASGSGADFHYRSEAGFFLLMEMARDEDRNGSHLGKILDRGSAMVVQNGFKLDPQTGYAPLNAELKKQWDMWASTPELCDVAGESTFYDFEDKFYRASLADGDIFATMVTANRDEGGLQAIEGHRVRSPYFSRRPEIVHGVELDLTTGEHKYIYVAPADIGFEPTKLKFSDMDKIPVRAPDGLRQVFHVANLKRLSQTRGVSICAPLFLLVDMLEDVEFANLVKAQIAGCVGFIEESVATIGLPPSDESEATGAREEITRADGTTEVQEEIKPGMRYRARPGETLTAFQPNVPNAEYFQHRRGILVTICAIAGVPYCLVEFDATEENFSGQRFNVDMAKYGWRKQQRNLVESFHTPVYEFKVTEWSETDPEIQRLIAEAKREGARVDLKRHSWKRPAWNYIEPVKDATADKIRQANLLASPRRIQAERGCEYEEHANEIVDDNKYIILLALAAVKEIQTAHPGAAVTWRDLLNPIGGKDTAGADIESAGSGQQNDTRRELDNAAAA